MLCFFCFFYFFSSGYTDRNILLTAKILFRNLNTETYTDRNMLLTAKILFRNLNAETYTVRNTPALGSKYNFPKSCIGQFS